MILGTDRLYWKLPKWSLFDIIPLHGRTGVSCWFDGRWGKRSCAGDGLRGAIMDSEHRSRRESVMYNTKKADYITFMWPIVTLVPWYSPIPRNDFPGFRHFEGFSLKVGGGERGCHACRLTWVWYYIDRLLTDCLRDWQLQQRQCQIAWSEPSCGYG